MMMRNSVALAAGVLLGLAGLVGPALAITETATPSYLQHQADCLALLFTNPKAHQEQCGGPFTVPPPPNGSTGYRERCQYGEIDTLKAYGTRFDVATLISC